MALTSSLFATSNKTKMAKTLKSVQFFALFFVIVLLANQEIPVTEAKICQKRSKTWTGVCACEDKKTVTTSAGDGRKHSIYSACHWQCPGFACFCYFNCSIGIPCRSRHSLKSCSTNI